MTNNSLQPQGRIQEVKIWGEGGTEVIHGRKYARMGARRCYSSRAAAKTRSRAVLAYSYSARSRLTECEASYVRAHILAHITLQTTARVIGSAELWQGY